MSDLKPQDPDEQLDMERMQAEALRSIRELFYVDELKALAEHCRSEGWIWEQMAESHPDEPDYAAWCKQHSEHMKRRCLLFKELESVENEALEAMDEPPAAPQ